jgi:hypothetical protein
MDDGLEKDLEGSGRDIIEVLSRNVLKRMGEKIQESQSGWSVSRPRFEPSISRIRV